MPDTDYKLNFHQTQSGDGGKKTARTIDEVREAMAKAKVEAEQLSAAENAAVAKDGKTDGNRDLRKLAQQARLEYQELEKQVTEFYETNGQGLDAMRAGYEEHIGQLGETKEAQEAATKAAHEEVKAQQDLTKARAEAEARARKSVKPGAEINQIDDSAIGSGRVARLKRFNQGLGRLAKTGLRFGVVFTAVQKTFGFVGKKAQQTGESMQDFARDMRDSGTAGAGLVSSLGKGIKAFGTWANFVDEGVDAIRNLAAEKRKLEKIEANVAAALEKRANDQAKAIKVNNEAIESERRYSAASAGREQAEKRFNDFITKTNRSLNKRLRLLDSIKAREFAEIDIKAEEDLDKVSDEDPKAAEKRFKIEKRREAEKEKVRRAAFVERQRKEAEKAEAVEKQKSKAESKKRLLTGLKFDKFGNEILSDEKFDLLKDKAKVTTDKAQKVKLDDQVKAQEKIRKNLNNEGFDGSANDLLAAIKAEKSKIEAKARELEELKTNSQQRAFDEITRRKSQTAGVADRQRDFTRENGKANKQRLEKKIGDSEGQGIDIGKDISSEAGRLAQNAKFDGGKVINEGFAKIAKAFADGVISEGEKLDIAPFLSQIQQSNSQQLGIIKALMQESKKNAQELQQLKQNLKNNL